MYPLGVLRPPRRAQDDNLEIISLRPCFRRNFWSVHTVLIPRSDCMRRRVFSLIPLLVVFVALAHADEWNKSYEVSGTPELRLTTSDANVRVTAGTGNKIEAHLTTSDYKIGSGGISVYEHQ